VNFFDAQDNAKRITKWLVVVYALATLLIVAGVTALVGIAFYGYGSFGQAAPAGVLIGAALLTLSLIVGSTLYRTASLSSGGGQVAAELGGQRITEAEDDRLRRRYRNVVEEISIASGVPVPEIYVLDHEQGINAFAAGFSPDDAAIAVTRGTLELLDRDELQGVVAHEFSHILNGDMRLNIRMMGVLFGIMVIGLIGRMILRSGQRGTVRTRGRGRGTGGLLAIGLGLSALGAIGVFMARLIKAAASRQREYLADASAVQFTRQTQGIAGALKKIGGYREHSYLQAADAEEVSHMLFALGANFSGWFATHPPLEKRIRALDPQFDAGQFPQVERNQRPQVSSNAQRDARAAGFAGVDHGATVSVTPDSIAESIGHPGPEHFAYAAALHDELPEELLTAAHSSSNAYLLVLAILITPIPATLARQFQMLDQQLGKQRTRLVRRYQEEHATVGDRYSLPLLEIAFPALRRSKPEQQQFLLDLGRKLMETDGVIDLREFCLYRILSRSLQRAAAPGEAPGATAATRAAIRSAAIALLQVFAECGQSTAAEQQSAFAAGMQHFGRWGTSQRFSEAEPDVVSKFSDALDVLQGVGSSTAETLVKAATATVLYDGTMTTEEAELLRTACISLGLPMPPVVAA